MAVNLVPQVGRDTAREILETSFAQFQADRAVVGLARQVRRNEEALEGYAEAMTCHLGDFTEYAALRNSIRDRETEASRARSASRRAEAELSLEKLRPGDVIQIPAGRRAGYAVVIQGNRGGKGEGAAPTVLTADRQVRRLTLVDVPTPVEPVTHVSIPKTFNARNPQSRRDLASTVRTRCRTTRRRAGQARADTGGEDERISELRRQMRAHPCHECPEREDHARWAERWWRLRARDRRPPAQGRGAHQLGRPHLRPGLRPAHRARLPAPTAPGDRLRAAPAPALHRARPARRRVPAARRLAPPRRRRARRGLSRRWSTSPVATRRELSPRMPGDDVSDAYTQMVRLWSELEDREQDHGLPVSTEPDAGMAWMLHRWASGQRLDIVLTDSDMAAGDFVRRCKQIVDLLGQIGDAAPQPALAATARKAVDAVLRGVVAADRLD